MGRCQETAPQQGVVRQFRNDRSSGPLGINVALECQGHVPGSRHGDLGNSDVHRAASVRFGLGVEKPLWAAMCYVGRVGFERPWRHSSHYVTI